MFRKKTQQSNYTPPVPHLYPVGMIVETEHYYFYIKAKDKALRLISARAMESWKSHVIQTSAINFDVPVVGSLGFRPGSVMRNFADGKIYVLNAGSLTLIDDPDTLDSIGNPEIIEVSQEEIDYQERVSKK